MKVYLKIVGGHTNTQQQEDFNATINRYTYGEMSIRSRYTSNKIVITCLIGLLTETTKEAEELAHYANTGTAPEPTITLLKTISQQITHEIENMLKKLNNKHTT